MNHLHHVANYTILLAMGAQAATDLELNKLVDNPQPASGEVVQFSVSVTNRGPDEALAVEVIDLLPAGLSIPAGMAAAPSTGSYDPATGIWQVGDMAVDVPHSLLIPAEISTPDPPPCLVNVATAAHPDDSNTVNDRAVAAVRRADISRCVDLRVEHITTSFDPLFCGETRSASIPIRIINAGPDNATTVSVSVSQSPVVAPNLRFNDARCTNGSGSTCNLTGLTGTIVLFLISDSFANPQSRNFTLTLSISGTDSDYDTANNQQVITTGFPEFGPCEPIDLPDGVAISPAPCFIATAAYGSPLHPHVSKLRSFRDRYLVSNRPGRKLVSMYYRHSPALASRVEESGAMRTVLRLWLVPLVTVISFPGTSLVIVLMFIGYGLSKRPGHAFQGRADR